MIAPTNLPFQLIRVDLPPLAPPQSPTFRSSMVAVGRPHTHATGFAIGTAFRVASARPEEDSSRKSPGYLRRGCGASADRHHRPFVGFRCGAARPDTIQGRGSHADLIVLVCEDP